MTSPSELTVRPLKAGDADALFATVKASLAELCYWMPWCKPDYAFADALAWIAFCEQAWAERREFPLGVFEIGSERLVGATGVNQINKTAQSGNIGYWVGTPYVGRGVARFAALQAARMGFAELGLTRLEIVTLTHNHASQRVAQALGAVRECEARNRLYLQGKAHDAVVYSLIPSDLPLSAK
jgi:ribosomal-protein-serine acetyltransferase